MSKKVQNEFVCCFIFGCVSFTLAFFGCLFNDLHLQLVERYCWFLCVLSSTYCLWNFIFAVVFAIIDKKKNKQVKEVKENEKA